MPLPKSILCPSCKHTYPEGWKRCPYCGYDEKRTRQEADTARFIAKKMQQRGLLPPDAETHDRKRRGGSGRRDRRPQMPQATAPRDGQKPREQREPRPPREQRDQRTPRPERRPAQAPPQQQQANSAEQTVAAGEQPRSKRRRRRRRGGAGRGEGVPQQQGQTPQQPIGEPEPRVEVAAAPREPRPDGGNGERPSSEQATDAARKRRRPRRRRRGGRRGPGGETPPSGEAT